MPFVRDAQMTDVAALLEIYAPYVQNTAITFETSLPSVEEFTKRIVSVQQDFPYLVAQEGEEILGYAYAHAYYGRAAYAWTVEVSIYIRQDVRKGGLGSLLYDELERRLAQQGVLNFLACISLPNDASISFHQKRGYEEVGHFKQVGFKLDRWHDIVWLQKRIGNPKKPHPLQKP